ncbi:hypothetical protein BJ165DRAFT_1403640 [Panaeolus papilionaceus]|nr:hypothetical protein BJ165DRAFT_1403640 [Panaeolus papilionaceus]
MPSYNYSSTTQQQSLIEDTLSQSFELSSSSSASCSPSVLPNNLQSEESTSHVIFHSPKYIFDCPPRNGSFSVDGNSTPPAFQLSDELKEFGDAFLRRRFEIPPGVEIGLQALPCLPRRKTPPIMALICLAIWQSEEKRISLQDIFDAVLKRFPSLDDGNCAWKRSIRHKLSLKAAFIKMRRPRGHASTKGCLWTFDASLGDADSPTRASRARPRGQKAQSVGATVRNSSPSSTSDVSVDSIAHESTALQLSELSLPQHWSAQYPSQSYPPTVASFYAPSQDESYMSYMQMPTNSQMAYVPFQETAYSTYMPTMPSYTQEEYYNPPRPTRGSPSSLPKRCSHSGIVPELSNVRNCVKNPFVVIQSSKGVDQARERHELHRKWPAHTWDW